MKNLILLIFITSIQLSSASIWEKTAWSCENSATFLAAEGEKALVAVNTGEKHFLRLTVDNGATWSDIAIDSLYHFELQGHISGNSIYLHWYYNSWHFAVSTDLGKTWNYSPNGLPKYQRIAGFTFSGQKAIVSIYSPGSGGLFMSSDGGVNWIDIGKNLKNAFSFGEICILNEDLYISTTLGKFYTSDLGGSWHEIDNIYFGISSIKPAGNRLFLLHYSSPHYYLMTSTDKGVTWKELNAKYPANFEPQFFTVLGDKIFLARQKYTIDGSIAKVYMSTDMGETWTEKDPGPFENKTVKGFFSSGNYLVANVGDSICVSTDFGASWAANIKGLPPMKYEIGELRSENNRLYVDLGNEIYVFGNSGLQWTKLYGKTNFGHVRDMASLGDTLFVACEPRGGNTTYWDALYYTVDKGETWRGAGFVGDTVKALFAGEGKLLARTNAAAYLSNDLGATWSALKDVWPDMWYVDKVVFAPGKIYAGNEFEGFKFSSDDGASWVSRNEGLPVPTYKLRDIQLVDGNLYVRVGAYYYFSSDEGATWSLRNKGLEEFEDNGFQFTAKGSAAYVTDWENLYYTDDYGVTWTKQEGLYSASDSSGVCLIETIDDYLVASFYNTGLFRSSDKGATWRSINDGFTNTGSIRDMLVQSGDYVYSYNLTTSMLIFDESFGIYRAKLSDLLSIKEENLVESGFSIAPNPAADFIMIKEYTGVATEFAITNILGTAVLSGSYTGGRIEISSLPAGTYFLRLEGKLGKFIKI